MRSTVLPGAPAPASDSVTKRLGGGGGGWGVSSVIHYEDVLS